MDVEVKSLVADLMVLCEARGSASSSSAGPSASSSSAGASIPASAGASIPATADGMGRGRGRGRGRGIGERNKYLPYEVKDAAGVVIGHLLHNEHARSFDMHCHLHPDCAIGRTYVPHDGVGVLERTTAMQQAKGRPLAFLVAWLRWGQQYADRESHMHARFAKGLDAPLGNGASDERLRARAYVESAPTLAPLRLIERQPRSGEGIEPLAKL